MNNKFSHLDEIDELSRELAKMPDTHIATNANSAYTAADINDILDDLDLEAATSDFEEEVIQEHDDDFLDDIDLKMSLKDNYAQQEAVGADPEAEPPVSTKKARTKSTTPRVSKPAVERDLTKIPDEFFVLDEGDPKSFATVSSEHRELTMKFRPAQKKVAEKFDNLFVSLAAGKMPSIFVVEAFKLLEKEGALSTGMLVVHYTSGAAGTVYLKGTAQSQAGQIMHLFRALGVIRANGMVYELNKQSTIAFRLRDLLAGVSA